MRHVDIRGMTISWYGEACFLLESGGTRVLIEPPQKESGINPPRLKSDILISSKLFDSENGAFVVNSPGEYEVKSVSISGIGDGDPSTSSGQANTIYTIEMDGIKMTYLGFLKKEPSNEKLEKIGNPDIVFAPVGGLRHAKGLLRPADGGLKGELFDAEAAMKLINKMEPKIAIPMLYDIKGLKIKRAPILSFIKESEAKDSPVPKLSVKKKDLVEEETKIVILEKV